MPCLRGHGQLYIINEKPGRRVENLTALAPKLPDAVPAVWSLIVTAGNRLQRSALNTPNALDL